MREEKRNEIEVHVAGICIRNNNGQTEVLAAKRADNRQLYPGMWECGGGSVGSGENFEEAMKRQHKEELNINSMIILPVGVYEIESPNLLQKKIPGIYFLCEVESGDPEPDKKELTECRWVPVNEIDKIDFIPGLTDNIRKAEELYKK